MARLSAMDKGIIRANVIKGAGLLDVVEAGWYDNIELPTLDLSDGVHCVIGQTFGGFGLGMRRLGERVAARFGGSDVNADEYGFDTELGTSAYNYLDDLWVEEIKMRRARDKRLLKKGRK